MRRKTPRPGTLPEATTLRTAADPIRGESKRGTPKSSPLAREGHWLESLHYLPDPELWAAFDIAATLGEPLLLTGMPGTGKTQFAYYAAHRLGLGEPLLFSVRSGSKARELFYTFDSIAYFHAANAGPRPAEAGDSPCGLTALDRWDYLHKGPLWLALESDQQVIVIIDEIDKAPRDFPNDLLNEIDQLSFAVPELGNRKFPERPPAHRPLVVVTSNEEQRLPEAFLRRCVYHHIELTEAWVNHIVTRRCSIGSRLHKKTGAWRGEAEETLLHLAIDRWAALTALELKKPPSPAELLRWTALLGEWTDLTEEDLRGPFADLPFLGVLIKHRDDLKEAKKR